MTNIYNTVKRIYNFLFDHLNYFAWLTLGTKVAPPYTKGAKKMLLDKNRRIMLNGYLCLLKEAEPNGRLIHRVAQYIQGLILTLKLDKDISKEYEEDIKNLIRDLYKNKKVFD